MGKNSVALYVLLQLAFSVCLAQLPIGLITNGEPGSSVRGKLNANIQETNRLFNGTGFVQYQGGAGLGQFLTTIPLSAGGTGSNLVDPNFDAYLFWNDATNQVEFSPVGAVGGTPNLQQVLDEGSVATIGADLTISDPNTDYIVTWDNTYQIFQTDFDGRTEIFGGALDVFDANGVRTISTGTSEASLVFGLSMAYYAGGVSGGPASGLPANEGILDLFGRTSLTGLIDPVAATDAVNLQYAQANFGAGGPDATDIYNSVATVTLSATAKVNVFNSSITSTAKDIVAAGDEFEIITNASGSSVQAASGDEFYTGTATVGVNIALLSQRKYTFRAISATEWFVTVQQPDVSATP